MLPESVIFSVSEALETCHLLNSKWLNFERGSLFLPLSLIFLPPAWPNPGAHRHSSISVTFDGPGLKQISIPLVDFKHCFNNNASEGWVNEDLGVNWQWVISESTWLEAEIISTAPPSSFPLAFFFLFILCLSFSLPSVHFLLSILAVSFSTASRSLSLSASIPLYSCSQVSEAWLN